ncbi:MAG: hypothetical protein QG635_923, partial [Bacteroidota bacterium]|nr:hypothetical protein [Bacteroidota bacterium]
MNKNKKSVFMLLPIFILIGLFLNSCGIDDSINNSPNAINTEKVKSVDGIQGLTIAMQVAASDWYCGDRSRISSIWTWQMCAPDGLGRSQPVAWNSYSMEEVGPTND